MSGLESGPASKASIKPQQPRLSRLLPGDEEVNAGLQTSLNPAPQRNVEVSGFFRSHGNLGLGEGSL